MNVVVLSLAEKLSYLGLVAVVGVVIWKHGVILDWIVGDIDTDWSIDQESDPEA